MYKKPTVSMIQVSQAVWKIVSTKKNVTLKDDITVGSAFNAETFVKGYCSSFADWTYEIIPLKITENSK